MFYKALEYVLGEVTEPCLKQIAHFFLELLPQFGSFPHPGEQIGDRRSGKAG